MKKILNLIGLLVFTMTAVNAQGIFSANNSPDLPGERTLSSEIELRGLQPSQCTVNCIYSTDSMEVVKALNVRTKTGREPSAQAKLTSIGNDKIRATIILPHRDKRQPNTRDRNPVVISHPSRVFYAWERSHIPSGAREELTISSPVQGFVMPRLLIIAYMGDSYASGEGAPNSNAVYTGPRVTTEATWNDDNCHRSEKSGGVLAIKKLIAEHPELAIRFVNTTCSGAILTDFMEADVREGFGGSVGWSKPAQFQQVSDWLKRNNRKVVDILLTDGGGNDVGFAPIATSALTAFFGDISKDEAVKTLVRNAVTGLAGGYDNINNKIQSEFYGFEVGRVVWFNYPNPVTDANGRLCSPGTNGNNPFDCWGALERQISDADMQYLRNEVLNALNGEVKKAADKYGWDFVDISSRSLNHGLCNCDAPYFNTLGQALAIQGDGQGTMHPNARGFREVYRDPVFQQLERSIELWHAELKKDAKERAIARAKEIAKAKARDQAQANAAKQPTVVFKKTFSIPKGVVPEQVKLSGEDTKAIQPDNSPDEGN